MNCEDIKNLFDVFKEAQDKKKAMEEVPKEAKHKLKEFLEVFSTNLTKCRIYEGNHIVDVSKWISEEVIEKISFRFTFGEKEGKKILFLIPVLGELEFPAVPFMVKNFGRPFGEIEESYKKFCIPFITSLLERIDEVYQELQADNDQESLEADKL